MPVTIASCSSQAIEPLSSGGKGNPETPGAPALAICGAEPQLDLRPPLMGVRRRRRRCASTPGYRKVEARSSRCPAAPGRCPWRGRRAWSMLRCSAVARIVIFHLRESDRIWKKASKLDLLGSPGQRRELVVGGAVARLQEYADPQDPCCPLPMIEAANLVQAGPPSTLPGTRISAQSGSPGRYLRRFAGSAAVPDTPGSSRGSAITCPALGRAQVRDILVACLPRTGQRRCRARDLQRWGLQ